MNNNMLLLVAVAVVLFLLLCIKMRRPPRYPPGPLNIPIIGQLLAVNPNQPFAKFQDWAKKYGKIYSVKIGMHSAVVLSSYELVREALNMADTSARAHFWIFVHFAHGKENAGILGCSGSLWHEQRRFTLRTLRDFGFGKSSGEEIIKDEIVEQIQEMKDSVTRGQPVTMSFNINIAITNIIWLIVAGERFDLDDEKIWLFAKNVNEDVEKINKSILTFLPKLEHILPGAWLDLPAFRKNRDVRFDYLKSVIANHIATRDENFDRDFIDVYLREMHATRDDPAAGFDDFQLLVLIHELFVAGGETTATTLKWAFLLLILHPHIQSNIQAEIDEVVGKDRMPTLDDMKSMPYTEASLYEIQRWADIVPMGVPHATTADIQLAGYTLPKGTVIWPNLTAVHNDADYFPEPRKLDPSRFLDENGKFVKKDGVIPFSIGRRVCLGETLARAELFLFLTCFLQQFTFKPADNNKPSLIPLGDGFLKFPVIYDAMLTTRNL